MKNDKAAEEAHPADYRPGASAEFPEGPHGVKFGPASHSELGEHKRRAEDDDDGKVYENERAPSVFTRDVWKTPDIPKPHGGTGGGHDKAESAPPLFSVS